MKAVVIGAGFAGLAAARRLKKANWDVVVLEQRIQVGGRVSTSRSQGYLLENGATQVSTGYQAYLALANDVGLRAEFVDCSNTIGLLRGGKIHEIDGTRPLAALFTGALSLRSKFLMGRAIADFTRLQPRMNVLDVSACQAYDVESAYDYCERRLNREIHDVLVDAAVRCYALNSSQHISVLEWFSFLRNLAGQTMITLRGGLQRLPMAVAATLDVRLQTLAKAIRRTAHGIEVDCSAVDGSSETLHADACVIATPLPDVQALAPWLTPVVAPLADRLTYNRAAVVHLGFTQRTHSKAVGILVGKAEHANIGLLWLEHNKLDEAVPPGHSLFSVYFEESGLAMLADCDDDRLARIALEFVTSLFPELTGTQDLQRVTRWSRAIPNPAPGIYRAVHEMKLRLDQSSPVQLAGDYFTCTGQNSAVHWGGVAADNLVRSCATASRLHAAA